MCFKEIIHIVVEIYLIIFDIYRGETLAGCAVTRTKKEDPNKCDFFWVVGLDLKLPAPQFMMNKEMANTMLRFVKELRHHIYSKDTTCGRH